MKTCRRHTAPMMRCNVHFTDHFGLEEMNSMWKFGSYISTVMKPNVVAFYTRNNNDFSSCRGCLKSIPAGGDDSSGGTNIQFLKDLLISRYYISGKKCQAKPKRPCAERTKNIVKIPQWKKQNTVQPPSGGADKKTSSVLFLNISTVAS